MYLSVNTRPDIAYAVGNLAKFNSCPSRVHWTALKRVLRYLKGTMSYGIQYKKNSGSCVIGFSDADWAGDVNDWKSTSGYLFQMNGGALTWKSKKQDCVALSTAEAEYVALSSAAQESVWFNKLSAELGCSLKEPTLIYEDNQFTISMCKNPQFHGRAKHIDIRHQFVRELVTQRNIELQYSPSQEMVADMLTKSLAQDQFYYLCDKAGIVPMGTASC